MNLTFTRPYLSIDSMKETEIADFCVITGLNGSGKTHLLKAINDGAIAVSGIDTSEIVYYNYNDFLVHSGDPATDPILLQKRNIYANRNNEFNVRLQNERNKTLDSFSIFLQTENMWFGTQSFQHISNFELLCDWSDDDISFYNAKLRESEDNSYFSFYDELRPNQRLFFEAVSASRPISDIRSFISLIKEFKTKVDAFHLIRNSNYSKILINWDLNELRVLPGLGRDIFENIRNFELRAKLSTELAFFIEMLCNTANSASYHQEEGLITFRNTIEVLFEEIEEHFIKHINPSMLSTIKGINSLGNILEPITAESGFLNLYEVALAEKQYQIQKKSNDYAEFRHSKDSTASYLSEKEFHSTYGESPVSIINKVLAEYDCNGYEFKQTEIQSPFDTDISQQQIYINLFNKKGNYITTLDSLSSGERTLLALSFTIFKLKQRKVIAKLFLLDEIDSALHPSMSKRLLSVLHNLFHQELRINLILSTHSPSTVAFAPEKSICLMIRDGEQRLSHTSRDRALSELTTGVPSFSINYENRRQVFVESQYDVQFYESLYNIYKYHLNPEISLNFIQSGDISKNSNGIGISNCEQVKNVTSVLRKAGNKFIWGIIDWDLNATKPQEQFVKVLGFERRYSVENYLLDPLLIAILLLREKFVEPSFFGFDETIKFFDVSTFDVSQLQQMTDAVLNKLIDQIEKPQKTINTYSLINGSNLSIPEWYCKYQGHKLEEKYLLAFPRLNEIKKKKEDALKQAVISKIVADFPTYAPMDLLEILKEVQEL